MNVIGLVLGGVMIVIFVVDLIQRLWQLLLRTVVNAVLRHRFGATMTTWTQTYPSAKRASTKPPAP
jgi:hypothetical protein